MRHRIKTRRLSRFSSLRKATINSLCRSLLINQSVKTTLIKSKAASARMEHLISLAKSGSLHARRQAYKILQDHLLVNRLFEEITQLFKQRNNGGYTRILKLGFRRGDGAQMALWELSEKTEKKKKTKSAQKEKEPAETTREKRHPGPEEKPKAYLKEKPARKFLGGIKGIFKKERDSL